MQFKLPYKDEPTPGRDLPIAYIESPAKSNARIIRQKISLITFTGLGTPFLTTFNNLPAFLVNSNFIPIKGEGNIVVINGQPYDKVETVLWS